MQRRIVGFHRDEIGDWVADLDCGHGQHVRHDPPWRERAWIVHDHTRDAMLGTFLNCKRCDDESH